VHETLTRKVTLESALTRLPWTTVPEGPPPFTATPAPSGASRMKRRTCTPVDALIATALFAPGGAAITGGRASSCALRTMGPFEEKTTASW